MITLSHYLKSKYISKYIKVTSFSGKEIRGILKKVYSSYIILEESNNSILVQISSIYFVKEVLKDEK